MVRVCSPVSQNIPLFNGLTVYNLTTCSNNGNFINMMLGVTNLSFPIDAGMSALSGISSLGDMLNVTQIGADLAPLYSALQMNFTSVLDGVNVTGTPLLLKCRPALLGGPGEGGRRRRDKVSSSEGWCLCV